MNPRAGCQGTPVAVAYAKDKAKRLTVLGGLAEFERDLIRARTGEGRERAQGARREAGPQTEADRPSAAGGNEAPRRGRRADPRHCPHLQRAQQHDFETRLARRGGEPLREITRSYTVSRLGDDAIANDGDHQVNALEEYIDLIVEPTFEDFRKHPGSTRHGFLACVVALHSVDRAARLMSKKAKIVREEWRSKSLEFTAIDMITDHFKHTHSYRDEPNPHHDGIPLSFALGLGDKPDQLETRNLVFLLRDVIKFLREQATTLP
jgi:hypothetical protein